MTTASASPDAFSARWQRQLLILLAGTVLLLATYARFHRLGAESFWLDEAYTFTRAAMPPGETIRASIEKSHVPTYFLFMHYWMALGDSEASLRAPSALFGVLSVAVAILLGWIAAGARPAIAGGVLVALSPLQVRYGQEARMYTMFTFAATIAMCGVLFLLKHPERAAIPLWRRAAASDSRTPWVAWLSYVAGAIGTLYLHNTGVFLIASCGACALLLLLRSPGKRAAVFWNWTLVHGAVFAVWSLWISNLLRQTGKVMRHFWPDFPTLGQILSTLARMYLYDVYAAPWLSVLLLALFLLGVWALRKQSLVAGGLCLLALLPPTLVLLVSLRTPMFLPRIILWAPIPFFVLAGVGLFALPWQVRALPYIGLALVFIGAYLSLQAYYYESETKSPWRDVAQVISTEYDNDSVVFATGSQERTTLNYYFKRRYKPVMRVPIYSVKASRIKRYVRRVETAWLLDGKRGTRTKTKDMRAELERRGELIWRQDYGTISLLKFKLNDDRGKEPIVDEDDDEQDDESPEGVEGGETEALRIEG